MAMKLLAKSELDRKKAEARKMDIDEGMKLARKVDNIREVLAQEEESLIAFRTSMVASISKEIERLEARKLSLSSEVSELARKRNDLLEPIDAELKSLAEARKEFSDRESSVSSRERMCEDRERISFELLADARERQRQVDEKEIASLQIMEEANRYHRDYKESVSRANSGEEKLLSERQAFDMLRIKTIGDFHEREERLASMERNISGRESAIEAKELDISVRLKNLQDQEIKK